MRKLSIVAIAAIAVLAFAGVAYAANVYDLPTAVTKPKGVGSPNKPVPAGVQFDYTVKDEAGPRGAPVETYKIAFQGLTQQVRQEVRRSASSRTSRPTRRWRRSRPSAARLRSAPAASRAS